MPMYILFLILGLLALAGSVYLLVKRLRAFFQDRKAKAVDKKLLQLLVVSAGLYLVSGIFLQLAVNFGFDWQMSAGEWTLSILGAGFFFLFFGSFKVKVACGYGLELLLIVVHHHL